MVQPGGHFEPYRPASKEHGQAIRNGLKRARLAKAIQELPVGDIEKLIDTAKAIVAAKKKLT